MESTAGPPGHSGSPGSSESAGGGPSPDSGRSRAFAPAGGTGTAPVLVAARAPRAPAPAERAPAPLHLRTTGQRPLTPPTRGHHPAPDSADRPSASFATEIVRQLIAQLAPLLGLDEARIAFGMTEHPGAPHGEASAHRIEVTGNPEHPALRSVVAHELTHVRQHENREREGGPGDATAAEGEAAGIAAALASGRAPWVPRARLPSGRTARDSAAQGVTTAPAPADPSSETSTTPDVAQLEKKLDVLVAQNHTADIRTIRDLLDHPWTQNTPSMVQNALRVLSGYPFVIARAIARAVPWPDRRKLAQLTDDHHTAYPEACIAVLSALTEKELAALGDTEVGVNGTPYPGVAAALRNVQPDRLSRTARRALLSTLRRAGKKSLAKLVDGDRRAVFRSLLESAPDAATDEADLRSAFAAEEQLSSARRTSDGDLRGRLERLLRAGGRESARQAVEALSDVALGQRWPLSQPATDPAVVPTSNPPRLEDLRKAIPASPPAGAGSNAPPKAPDALAGLVAELDGQGLIARLVEDLDEEDRRAPDYGKVLRVVLAARSPAANTSRAIELLSYGIFDWAVRDSEARLAYLLVRSLPIDAQDAWRQLDNGKWFGRLLANLPQDMWDSGEYTGVGTEYSTGAVNLGVPETMLLGYARGFIDLWDQQEHELIALWIVRNLLGLSLSGDPNPWVPGDAAKDLALRTAIVRRLDALQGLNGVIAKLPDSYLLGEQTRQELLDLNQMRDPVHLVRQALGLMPGLFGIFTFSPHDAWIALQALRALSPAAQQQFAVENPSVWSTFWQGLTDEMRRALPSTLATGRDARLPTRAALRDRLNDERLWTEPNALVLRALVGLAVAADDRLWVFELSRRLRVDRRLSAAPQLAAVLRDFGLYHEVEGRTVFEPRQTDTSHSPSGLRMLGVIAKGLVLAVYHLGFSDARFSLMGKTMHVKGFDLSQLQSVRGGDIVDGVTLATSPGFPFDRAPAGTNSLDLEATFADGFLVNLELPRVDIAGVNMVLPGKSYKSGPISITGFRVSAGFSDRGYTRPGYVAATLDGLDLRDFVIVDPALPLSGAWAVANLGMSRLGFTATPDASSDPSLHLGRELPKGTIPIPVFGPMFQLLANIVSLNGSIPGDQTLLDYAMIPLKLPFPIGSVANEVFPTPKPATYVWGLASDGVLRPPYAAAQRIKDSTAMLRAFNVAFDKLEVKGISIGSGQQIASLVLENVNVTVGQSLPAYLRAARDTVHAARTKLPADSPQALELEQRERALDKQLEAALGADAADEKRLQELEGKDRWSPGSLEPDERAELVRLTKKLRSDVGLVVEIGSMALGPLSGAIQSPGVTLKGIHARTRLPNVGVLPYAPGYLDDKSLIDQFTAGGPKVPTIGELAKSSEFHLEIDETTLASTGTTQPAVILNAETIPTVDALRAELAALPAIEGNRPVRERLAQALATVVALEKAKKDATDAPTEAARLAAAQHVRVLTDQAKRLLGTEIGGLRFGRITGDLDPSGNLAIALNDIEATAIAGRGFAIDKAAGTVSVGLSAGSLDARPDQVGAVAPDRLVTQLKPSFGLSGLTVSGIHLPGGSIGRVALGKLGGTLHATPDGYRVPDLTVDHLEVEQVAMGQDGDGILAESVTIDGLSLGIDVRIGRPAGGAATVTGAVIPSLSITRLAGRGIVFDSPQPDGSTTHVAASRGTLHDIRATEIAFAQGSTGWELLRAKASVDRFEDVAFELAMGALSSRTTVKGTVSTATTGRSGTATFTASYATGDGASTISLRLRDLLARGTDVTTPDGSLTVRNVRVAADYDTGPKGGRATAHLSGLVIGPIRWKAGTAVLSGEGPLTAASVSLAAVQSPAVPAKGKKPAKPAAWSVTDIVITKLTGRRLKWTDTPLVLDLGRSDKAGTGEPPLTVGRIHLKPAQNSLELSDLAVDVEGTLTDTLGVKGSLSVDFLSVDVLKGDRLHAVVRGVSGSATLSGDYTATVALSGLEGAAIDVSPDAIRFGSDDPTSSDGLHIAEVSVSGFDVTQTSGGHKVHLFTNPGGRVDLLGIRATARLDRRRPPVAGKSAFTKLAFEKFSIERVVLGAVQIDVDDKHTIVIPATTKTEENYLRDVELTSPVGTDPSTLHPDFTIDFDTMKVEGTASLAALSVAVQAELADTFSGEVRISAGESALHLFAGGGLRVDVANPLVTMAKAAQLGKDKTIRVGKFGAEKLSYTDAGHLYVKKPFVGDLEFTKLQNGQRAIWIKVKSMDLSQLDYDSAAGGRVDIPSLDIADAYVEVSLAALTGGPPKKDEKTTPSSTFDPTSVRPVLDELDGWIGVEMYVATEIVAGLKDIHIGNPNDLFVVPIVKGEIDLPTFERNLHGKITATPLSSGVHLRPWVIEGVAKDPMFALRGNQLQLGVYVVNPDFAERGLDPKRDNRPDTPAWIDILAWDLRRADLSRAWNNKFSLWSAVFDFHAAPEMTEEELQKLSEDDRQEIAEKKAAAQATLDSLELRTLTGSISFKNADPIRLPISTESAKGSVVLSKGALTSLTFQGGIPAVDPPLDRPGQNPGRLDLALQDFSLDTIDLTLYDYDPPAKAGDAPVLTGLSAAKTGKITITELKNGSMSFIDLVHPGRFKGTITKAHAANISWFRY